MALKLFMYLDHGFNVQQGQVGFFFFFFFENSQENYEVNQMVRVKVVRPEKVQIDV